MEEEKARAAAEEPEEEEEDEIVESDIEFEGETVVPDNDPAQKMGDSSVEVTEENRDASQEAKAKAMESIKMKKPNAAIRDANAALEAGIGEYEILRKTSDADRIGDPTTLHFK